MKRALELQIGERILPSGLTLLAVRNPGVPTFACAVSLDVLPGDERESQMGLANLVGDTLDEGTAKHDALSLAAAAERLGASLGGNQRGGAVMCPAAQQREALKLLREMVLEPSFPAREVKRVQGELLTELKTEADDPRTVAAQRFRKAIYGKHPLGRPTNGTPQSLQKLSRNDLQTFHRTYFRPNKGYVAAAGPDAPEAILDGLEKVFKSFRGAAPEHAALPTLVLAEKDSNVHVPMAREQVHVFLGHLGIARQHPDFYTLSVLDHILGTGPGFTSRCSKKLRDEQGLCYSVSAGITASAGELPGMFTAYIGTSPEHRQRAIEGFLAEIRRIREEVPSEQELQDVKDYLTGSFVFAFERNSNLAAYAIRVKRFGLGFDYLHRYPDLIRAVTVEQVREAALRHLHPDRLAIVSAGAGK